MKKFFLFSSGLLALISLSGCALTNKLVSNLPSSQSQPLSSSSWHFDFEEDEDFDFEDDYSSSTWSSSSSSSASSSSDSSSSSSYRDKGEALNSLTDMGDIPEWETFKNIVITPYTIGTDQKATSKEQIRNLLGEPDEVEGNTDFWSREGRGITVTYDSRDQIMDKTLMIADGRTLSEASDVSYGTSVQEVLNKFGRPNIITSQLFSTRFYWKMANDQFFAVSFIKEKAISSTTVTDSSDDQ